jgi:arylesterase/paraoxonase
MAGVIASRAGLAVVVSLAIGLQLFPVRSLITLVQLGTGYGKNIQPLSDFPYQCRRIEHPLLQACEDMWLSEPTRKLYLACSDSHARLQWFPSVDHYNHSGRSEGDNLVLLDLDQPGLIAGSKAITVQKLETPDYSGTAGDGFLSLNGFTGVDMGNGVVRLLVVNNRPSIDPATGTYAADQASAGVNATVEVFESRGNKGVLSHLLTLASPNISTPNRVAAFGSEGFYITNDHGKVKSGKVSP